MNNSTKLAEVDNKLQNMVVSQASLLVKKCVLSHRNKTSLADDEDDDILNTDTGN